MEKRGCEVRIAELVDGEIFVTSRQDGTIRRLVPDEEPRLSEAGAPR